MYAKYIKNFTKILRTLEGNPWEMSNIYGMIPKEGYMSGDFRGH